MTFEEYRSECDRLILSIHGVDMSKFTVDEEQLQTAMDKGIDPIDIAIEFDINNCISDD